MKLITAIIPCFNEEKGIAAVIKGFPKEELRKRGYVLEVLVVDNCSDDATAAVAKRHGAKVITESKKGKGHAIRAGFYATNPYSDFVVMLDGDNTYLSSEILRLIEPLDCGFADAVIGSRMAGKMKSDSMKTFNLFGNWFFLSLVRVAYKVNVTDALSGYFAWNKQALLKLRPHITSEGFAVEMEMITKMARLGLHVYSVPISYEPRLGDSSLRPLHDGARILMTFLKQFRWNPQAKRIAFVSDAIYPYHMGGKEKRLNEITRRLVKENREIHIYTMQWWDGPKTIVQDGFYLHAIGKKRPLYVQGHRSIKQALFFSLSCFKLLFKKFDIVDVDHMPIFPLISMRIVCWLKFKRLNATWHEVWGREYWHTYLGRRGIFGWISEYISFRLPDVIISDSLHTTIALRECGVKKEIKTIPLGVDLAQILSSRTSKLESDVIYAGRLIANKNVDMLVRALAEAKNFKKDISCILIGNGPERESLEALVSELKLQENITFLNFIDDSADMYGIMKASKVLVLPSEREGFGLIALEANACDLPVLTLNHPHNAVVDLITPGVNGDLFDDEKSLASLIKKYVGDPQKRELKPYVEKYDWAKTAELIQEEYAL